MTGLVRTEVLGRKRFKQVQQKLQRNTGIESEELMPGWKEMKRDGDVPGFEVPGRVWLYIPWGEGSGKRAGQWAQQGQEAHKRCSNSRLKICPSRKKIMGIKRKNALHRASTLQ